MKVDLSKHKVRDLHLVLGVDAKRLISEISCTHEISGKGPVTSSRQLCIDRKFLHVPGQKMKEDDVLELEEKGSSDQIAKRYVIPQRRRQSQRVLGDPPWMPTSPYDEDSSNDEDGEVCEVFNLNPVIRHAEIPDPLEGFPNLPDVEDENMQELFEVEEENLEEMFDLDPIVEHAGIPDPPMTPYHQIQRTLISILYIWISSQGLTSQDNH